MHFTEFEFSSIGDAALKLSIPRNNLRYWADIGLVPSRRVSDGSRIFSHDDLKVARKKIDDHLRAKEAARKERAEAVKKIKTRGQRIRGE